MTGLVKAVIEMSSKIQPAPPEEYVPMVKVKRGHSVWWGWPSFHREARADALDIKAPDRDSVTERHTKEFP